MSGRKRAVFALLAFFGAALVALAAGEVIVRAIGHTPFRPTHRDIRVEPGGKYQTADPVLGYRHLPGTFRFTFPDGHVWTATHLDDSLRITRPLDSYARDLGRDEIWLFGCSLVHGWGVDDYQTLGWQMQLRLPDHEVVNFGVGGYGTWQSYLQYGEALAERAAPRFVVLVYASLHDERNTRTRNWRRATYEFERFGTTAQPYVRLGEDGELEEHFDRATYRGFFLLRHSALANFLDLALGKAEEKALRSREVSQKIIERFAARARDQGSRFVLAVLNRDAGSRAMLEWAGERGLPAVDISVDMTRPENRVAYDGHPSGAANRRSASLLVEFLDRLDSQQTSVGIDQGAQVGPKVGATDPHRP